MSWEILDAWRDAAEECGIPKIAEFNRGDNFGNAYFQMNQRRGVRWSATKAFLRPVLKRPNLTVRTGALVERVAIETRDGVKRATGVVARYAGAGTETLRARREVLLAAGSIGSPQILQLSGVGPAELLRAARRRGRGGFARRRRELARSPADPLDLQSAEHAHAESARAHLARPRRDGARVRDVPHGAVDDAAVAARRVREERRRPQAREHRVARAAVVARQVRLAAARVRRDHAVGLQLAADEPRPRAHQERRSGRASGDRVELPRDRRGRARRGRGAQVHAAHHGGESARALRARGVAAGRRRSRAMRT